MRTYIERPTEDYQSDIQFVQQLLDSENLHYRTLYIAYTKDFHFDIDFYSDGNLLSSIIIQPYENHFWLYGCNRKQEQVHDSYTADRDEVIRFVKRMINEEKKTAERKRKPIAGEVFEAGAVKRIQVIDARSPIDFDSLPDSTKEVLQADDEDL